MKKTMVSSRLFNRQDRTGNLVAGSVFEKKCGESVEIRKYHLKFKEIKIIVFSDTLKMTMIFIIFLSLLTNVQTQKINYLFHFFRGERTFQNVYMNTGS